jgi:hypothetical protein
MIQQTPLVEVKRDLCGTGFSQEGGFESNDVLPAKAGPTARCLPWDTAASGKPLPLLSNKTALVEVEFELCRTGFSREGGFGAHTLKSA